MMCSIHKILIQKERMIFMEKGEVLKMLKIAFTGVGREAVNKLIKEFDNKKFPMNAYLSDTVQDALRDGHRNFLSISKKKLDKEIAILNGIEGEGIELLGSKGSVEQYDYKLANIIKKATGSDATDEWSRKELTNELKGFEADTVISFGAGAVKGRLIPGKLICYEVFYPDFKIKHKEAAISFLEQLRDCPTVVNSMFCFAGSAKMYKKAIQNLKK